jgi:hypothetical protein
MINSIIKESISQFAKSKPNPHASPRRKESRIPLQKEAPTTRSRKSITQYTLPLYTKTRPVKRSYDHPSRRYLCLVGSKRTSKAALAEVILNGALLGASRLRESDRSTKGARERRVLELSDADTRGASDGAGAHGARWHLDSDGEIHRGSGRETADADTWHVLGDFSGLECSGVGSAGGGVDGSGQGTGAVLIDLVEGHLDCSVVGACGHAGGGSCAGCGLDASLGGAGWGLGSAVGGADGEGAAQQHGRVDFSCGDGFGAVGVSAHEEGDHLGGIDGAGCCSAESRGLVGSELLLTDDGSIRL